MVNDFEQLVLSGLSTLQAEMRQVLEASKVAASGIQEHDRRVMLLEREIHSLRGELVKQGADLQALQKQVGELMEIRQGAQWSANAVRWLWRVGTAVAAAAAGWWANSGGGQAK